MAGRPQNLDRDEFFCGSNERRSSNMFSWGGESGRVRDCCCGCRCALRCLEVDTASGCVARVLVQILIGFIDGVVGFRVVGTSAEGLPCQSG